jgi:alanine racemase
MTRSGILADRAPALIHKARHQPGVALTGLYTHYPVADMLDKTFTHQQLALFLDTVKKAGSDAEGCILHTASSAPTINMPETHLDMVRVGLATYGYQPSDEDPKRLPLQPILRLVCKLGQVKDVPAGTRIGYGLTYRFERDSKVGLIQIGYGDGYCRGFSNRAVMKVAGRYVPVRGRVSMDQATIDLTDVPDAKIGDEVEVISSDPKAPNSLENLARLIDTIPAVIASGLGYRIRRVTVA